MRVLYVVSYFVGMVACWSLGASSDGTKVWSQEIRHSLFIAGPDFTGILDEAGQEVWKADRAGARDGFVLPNGNLLIAWHDVVLEFASQSKQTVFEYHLHSDNQEIGTAARLPDGRTLITELGAKPRLLEVDAQGKVQLEVALQPETDNAHMQTRMARKLPNGNYLVPHLLAFRVKEYTPQGEVVAQIATDLEELGGRQAENWPFTAIRLENGNTLVNLTHGNKTVEFDSHGSVVWKVSNDDLTAKPFVDPCGGQRLPNGNTVITSYGAQKGIFLFEVTPEKKMVWSQSRYRAHEFQVLTTNGVPLPGPPLK